jgi:hypothetical protein
MTDFRIVSLLVAILAACTAGADQPVSPASGGPDGSAAPAEPSEPTAAADGDPAAACAAMFVRLRECTDEFIPALVSWRVELDVPAGIADQDRDRGRDALVSDAMTEWETDSTDGAIAEMCNRIITSIPPEQLGAMLDAGSECETKSSCADVVTCIEPMQRDRLKAQRAADSQ